VSLAPARRMLRKANVPRGPESPLAAGSALHQTTSSKQCTFLKRLLPFLEPQRLFFLPVFLEKNACPKHTLGFLPAFSETPIQRSCVGRNLRNKDGTATSRRCASCAEGCGLCSCTGGLPRGT
jgi:hypothetical protein